MPRKKPTDWYRLGGAFLLGWGVLNTAMVLDRFGWSQGRAFWFCNLALLGTGYGLWRKQRDWLIAFMGVACFTQVFWIVDNLYRILTGSNLFGLVEFMYQPGMPLNHFIVVHYHYFIMPLALMGLCFLKPARKKGPSWVPIVVVLNILIFGASYLFPEIQNLNCIHEPCFPQLEHWKGPIYSIGFFLFVLCGNLCVSKGLDRVFPLKSLAHNKKHKQDLIRAFCGVCGIGIGMMAVDIHHKTTLPSFRCDRPYFSDPIAMDCRYTDEYDEGVMVFVYSIRNQSKLTQVCTSYMEMLGRKAVLHEDIFLSAHQTQEIPILLDYPTKTARAVLSADCEPDIFGVYSGNNTPKLPE